MRNFSSHLLRSNFALTSGPLSLSFRSGGRTFAACSSEFGFTMTILRWKETLCSYAV